MSLRISMALALVACAAATFAATPEEDLLEAIRQGDVAAVKKLLDGGVSANAKYRYDRSALSFAADRGNVEIVTLLLDRGADAAAQDTYYKMTALSAASMKGHVEIVRLLLARNPKDAGGVLLSGVFGRKLEVMKLALAAGTFTPRDLSYALAGAERAGFPEGAALLREKGAVPPPPADFKVPPEVLARYAGTYRSGDEELRLTVVDGVLNGAYKKSGFSSPWSGIDERRFLAGGGFGITAELVQDGARVTAVEIASIGSVTRFLRVEEAK